MPATGGPRPVRAARAALFLTHIDVAAWMEAGSFPPAGVTYLYLRDCVLPDDPTALDFPDVHVVIH
ncbi:senescence marker protein-30 family protein [Streptomyces azureus]|uniref:Senescence marker protein-30 family protein n=1 Tax=Streptomyces azureus TaxID=146537 RepID=A0A0K8PV76_STRAJ|nr:senescence marker protein-30 family protein [Streptomyces azureus]